jgi:small subunit ribosomal protein S8
MNDPIADFLTRIRNAGLARKVTLQMPSSKVKAELARILKEEGYIESYEVVDLGSNKKDLSVTLRFSKNRSVIEGLRRVSKGSCRVYVQADEIPRVRAGLGTSILSTSQGLMTGKSAKSKNVGGELIALVW